MYHTLVIILLSATQPNYFDSSLVAHNFENSDRKAPMSRQPSKYDSPARPLLAAWVPGAAPREVKLDSRSKNHETRIMKYEKKYEQ